MARIGILIAGDYLLNQYFAFCHGIADFVIHRPASNRFVLMSDGNSSKAPLESPPLSFQRLCLIRRWRH